MFSRKRENIERGDLETWHQGSLRDCVKLIFNDTKKCTWARSYCVNAYSHSSKDRDLIFDYTMISGDEQGDNFARKNNT